MGASMAGGRCRNTGGKDFLGVSALSTDRQSYSSCRGRTLCGSSASLRFVRQNCSCLVELVLVEFGVSSAGSWRKDRIRQRLELYRVGISGRTRLRGEDTLSIVASVA